MFDMKPNSFSDLENFNKYMEEKMRKEISNNFYNLGEYFFAEYCNRIAEAPRELQKIFVEIKMLQDKLGIKQQSKSEVLERMKVGKESTPTQEEHQEVESKTDLMGKNAGMRICPNCGSEVEASFKFCTSCGYQMPAEEKKEEVKPANTFALEAEAMEEPQEEVKLESVEEPVIEPEAVEERDIVLEAVCVPEEAAKGAGPRICPNCGSEVASSFKFCISCGYQMPAEEKKEEVKPANTFVLETEEKEKPQEEVKLESVEELVMEPEAVEEPVMETDAVEERDIVSEAFCVPEEAAKGAGTRICPTCGSEVGSSCKFCTSCGYKMPIEELKEDSDLTEKLQEKIERDVKVEPEIIIDSNVMKEIEENVEREVREEPKPVEITAASETNAEEKRVPLFCVQCGNKLRPGSRFCTKCGRKII